MRGTENNKTLFINKYGNSILVNNKDLSFKNSTFSHVSGKKDLGNYARLSIEYQLRT